MKSLAQLILRLTYGSLMVGHGAQKLFGAFKGPGLDGTAGFMESLGLKPGRTWATLAGVAELGGGTLVGLGLLSPIGPLMTVGAMGMATSTAHRGKPIWVSSGGAELPVTNIAVATSLVFAGPGTLSLDALLGTRLPGWIAIPGLAAIAGSIYVGLDQATRDQLIERATALLGVQVPTSQEPAVQQPSATGAAFEPSMR